MANNGFTHTAPNYRGEVVKFEFTDAELDEKFFTATLAKIETYLTANQPSAAFRFMLAKALPNLLAAVMEGGAI